jgi:hypothetical protein
MADAEKQYPPPAKFLTYSGDVTHIVGEVKGPNTLNELVTAVTAVYDPETDKTRVGFAYGDHR